MRSSWLIFAFTMSNAACLRQTEFHCASSAECGAGGTCESVGFCSFPDGDCTSGVRFNDSAGALANQCVGSPMTDGGTDGPVIDAMIDAPANVGCPGNYATITGGQGTHRYRAAPNTLKWNQQRDFCLATTSSAYLAVPDDAAELQGLSTLVGAERFWIGVTDAATENTWLTVKGAPATYLPWGINAPNLTSPNQDDCVSAITDLKDESCNQQYTAVCECEP